MLELRTEYVFDLHITAGAIDDWMIVGDGGRGTRAVIGCTGGTIEGPHIKGVVRSFGGDCFVIRHDKIFEADVRIVIETDDEALIYMYYDGILDFTEEEIGQILKGEPVRTLTRAHTTPRFEVGHERYLWMNKSKFAAIGELNTLIDPPGVNYSVYALR